MWNITRQQQQRPRYHSTHETLYVNHRTGNITSTKVQQQFCVLVFADSIIPNRKLDIY